MTWLGWLVLTARAAGGTYACPSGFPAMASGRDACCSVPPDGRRAELAEPVNEPFAVSEVPGDPAAVAQAVSPMLAVSTVIAIAPARMSLMGPDVSAACADHTAVSIRFP
jgi:hypothetical protein